MVSRRKENAIVFTCIHKQQCACRHYSWFVVLSVVATLWIVRHCCGGDRYRLLSHSSSIVLGLAASNTKPNQPNGTTHQDKQDHKTKYGESTVTAVTTIHWNGKHASKFSSAKSENSSTGVWASALSNSVVEQLLPKQAGTFRKL
jgi:hypothetical protein